MALLSFRELCLKIARNPRFEQGVLLLIILNSLLLAAREPFAPCCDTLHDAPASLEILNFDNSSFHCSLTGSLMEGPFYSSKDLGKPCCYRRSSIQGPSGCSNARFRELSTTLDRIFNTLFTVEFIIKVTGLGIRRYFSDPFNVMDFLVVVFGWLSELEFVANLSVLRSFKVLRPLRTLGNIKELRNMVNSIALALPALSGVLVLAGFVLIVFGVIAYQLFGGLLRGRCYISLLDGEVTLNTLDQIPCPMDCQTEGCIPLRGIRCEDRAPVLLTMTNQTVSRNTYCLDSGENLLGQGFAHFDTFLWSLLNVYVCITLEGWVDLMYAVSTVFGRTVFVTFFFSVLVSFSAFFLLELLLAVISDEYAKTREEKLLHAADVASTITKDTFPPSQSTAAVIFNSWTVETLVTVCIVLNAVIMGLEGEPPLLSEQLLSAFNTFFTLIFLVEFLVKIFLLGFRSFLADSFNVFDALLVFVGVFELVAPEGLLIDMSVLRLFRLLRVLKLIKRWKRLRRLLHTILLGLKDCVYALILLLVVMFLFTLLGMEFFGGIYVGSLNPPRPNFDSFWSSLLVVFQVFTGENWNELMQDVLSASNGSALPVFYFLGLNFVGNYIVFNLFLAVLLARFNEDDEDEEEHATAVVAPLGVKVRLPTTYFNFSVIKDFMPAPRPVLKKACHSIGHSTNFRKVVLACILLNIITLILDEPWLTACLQSKDIGSSCRSAQVLRSILFWMDLVCNLVFTIEFIAMSTTLGLSKYIASIWNMVDAFLVGLFWISLFLSDSEDARAFSALKALKVLRPLRTIPRFPNLSLVVNALLAAVPNMIDVVCICFLFVSIFAIIGVQTFKGGLGRCSNGISPDKTSCEAAPPYSLGLNSCYELPTESRTQHCLLNGTGGCEGCMPAVWISKLPNFDNFPNAFLAVFEIASGEMWPSLMYNTIDINYTAMNVAQLTYPHRENRFFTPIYFICTIFVCSFIMLNIVIGVIVDNFNRIRRDNGSTEVLLTSQQKAWVNLMKHTISHDLKKRKPPSTRVGKFLFRFMYEANEGKTELFFQGLILLNSLFFLFKPTSPSAISLLELSSRIFLLLFTIEALAKLLALEEAYFSETWNILNLVLLIIDYLTLAIDMGSLGSLLRIFRLFRLLQLLSTWSKLKVILSTFVIALPSVFNLACLFLLQLTIFAILFTKLFAAVKFGDFLNQDANFGSFSSAVKTLVRMSTGESFNGIMHDLMVQPPFCEDRNCGSPVLAPVLVCTFFMLSNYILLSMITAIVLDNFNETLLANSSQLSSENIKDFENVWLKFDRQNSHFVPEELLREIVRNVKYPLGAKGARSKLSLRKYTNKLLQQLNVKVVKGKISYNDTLSELLRLSLGMSEQHSFEEASNISDVNEYKSLRERSSLLMMKKASSLGLSQADLLAKPSFDSGQKAAGLIVQAAARGYIHRTKLRQLVAMSSRRITPLR